MTPRWLLTGLLKARCFWLAALVVTGTDLQTLGMGRPRPGLGLTICGSWMSARLEMRAWLRPASSFRRLSLLCSISLFSASIVFKLLSIDVICNGNDLKIKGVEFGRSTTCFSSKGMHWLTLKAQERLPCNFSSQISNPINSAKVWNGLPKCMSSAQTSPAPPRGYRMDSSSSVCFPQPLHVLQSSPSRE